MSVRKLGIIIVVLLGSFATLSMTGCAKSGASSSVPAAPRPGSANAFDSATFDALVTIQAGIEQAKIGVTPTRKPLLTRTIADYNLAERAYQAYHAAANAPNQTATQQQAIAAQAANLQGQIDGLKANLSTLGVTK